MVTGAVTFGLGVVLGANLVIITFIFHRWYEGYYRITGDPEVIHPTADGEPIVDEEYFQEMLNYSDPDFSDEALERYARHADIVLGSELDEEEKNE